MLLIDRTDGRGYCFVHDRHASRLRRLPHTGALDVRGDRGLTWRLQSRCDGVVVCYRHLVPDLKFIEALCVFGHVDRLELAIVSLDVDDPLIKIDTLYRARKSDGLGLLSDLGPARQRRS